MNARIELSIQGGTGCGTDPVSAIWSVPYSVAVGGSGTGAAASHPSFRKTNPSRIYSFVDSNGPNGSVTADLKLLPGTSQMKLEVVSEGDIGNLTVSPNPPQLPVSKKQVASC